MMRMRKRANLLASADKREVDANAREEKIEARDLTTEERR
jgi:hypothetical protein